MSLFKLGNDAASAWDPVKTIPIITVKDFPQYFWKFRLGTCNNLNGKLWFTFLSSHPGSQPGHLNAQPQALKEATLLCLCLCKCELNKPAHRETRGWGHWMSAACSCHPSKYPVLTEITALTMHVNLRFLTSNRFLNSPSGLLICFCSKTSSSSSEVLA